MTKRKVFVVDDQEPIADLLGDLLREEHYDVETFYDAQSAMERAQKCLPDVLVTDIFMPGMTGASLAQALRGRGQKCTVILISGSPEWEIRGEITVTGLDEYELLLKPFPIARLFQLVGSVPCKSTELIRETRIARS